MRHPPVAALAFTVLAAWVVALAVPFVTARHAAAATTVDQTLPGNPACTEANFPAPISSSNAVAVPFVPGQPQLVSVELCLKTTAAGFVGLNVWQGTPANRQVLRSSITLHVPAGVTGFVRFDLPAVIDIPPGQPHFLEVPNSQPFQLLSQAGTGATVGFRTWCSAPDETPTPPSTHTHTATLTGTPTATRTPTPTPTPTGTAPATATGTQPATSSTASPSPESTVAGATPVTPATPGATRTVIGTTALPPTIRLPDTGSAGPAAHR